MPRDPDTVDSLIAFCRKEGRVCPNMGHWGRLWKRLPKTRRLPDGQWEPPLPLILGAWFHTSVREKRERLVLHIQWANTHGSLSEVSDFLRSLQPDEWLKDDRDH